MYVCLVLVQVVVAGGANVWCNVIVDSASCCRKHAAIVFVCTVFPLYINMLSDVRYLFVVKRDLLKRDISEALALTVV